MPTYEYHCPSCKKNYDLQESFSAETTHTCKKCGKGTAKRVLHAPRVHFKGSGFYVTDSKNKSSSTSSTSSSSTTDSSPSSDDTSGSSESTETSAAT